MQTQIPLPFKQSSQSPKSLGKGLRILFVGLNHAPEPTGVGKYTGEMAKAFSGMGHEVRVVCAPPYYPWWQVQSPYSAFRYRRECLDGIEVLRCPLYVPKRLNGWRRLIHLASAGAAFLAAIPWGFRFRPQLIINLQPTLTTSITACILSKLSGAPLWMHVQDLEVAAADQLAMLPKRLLDLAERIEAKLYSRCRGVSTISSSMAAQLKERGCGRHVPIFPNWVDTDLIRPIANGPYRSELGLDQDDFVALYSGNMGAKQGLEIIVKAAKVLENNKKIKFVLAGEGTMRQRLEEMSKSLSNVRFLPLQPAERMAEFLGLGDVHLVPQKAGVGDLVMPSKMTAIMAAGRPSIVTAMPTDELALIGDLCGVSVLPGDVAGFANAIRHLSANREQCCALGASARQYALDHFASTKILGDMEAYARRLAKRIQAIEAVDDDCNTEGKTQSPVELEKRLSATGTAGLP